MKVLIAEDDKTTRFMLESLLRKWGYDVISASDGSEAWNILSSDSAPALALIDWLMPGMEGIEICSKVRERCRKNGRYQYIILLTVQSDMENILEGLDAGADDYVVKPFDSQELRMRLQVGKRIISLQEKLAFSASHDYLTKLLNRRALFSRLDQEISRAARSKTPLVVALMDLDFFKKVNDTYGHLAGDEILRLFSREVKAHLRHYDIVGRYGGEEFLAILPGASEEEAFAAMDRLREHLHMSIFKVEELNISITVSIGLALYRDGMSLDELISVADRALYRAKGKGRNRVCVGPEDVD